MRQPLYAFVSLVICGPLLAEELPGTVALALNNTVDDVRDRWAFTETRVHKGSTTIANYDARKPEGKRWQLESVDDREPDPKEVRNFNSEKQKARKEAHERRGNRALAATIDAGTLELVAETPHVWRYRFRPVDEEDNGFMEHVDGTLVISKQGIFVKSMILDNNSPIKPALGVRLDTFRTVLEFAPISDDGPVLPFSVDTHVAGRAYLAVRFDEVEQVRYSNWEYVGSDPAG